MKIEIGNKVESKKNGIGIITRIITKSTGYVEVDYNGVSKKEMAFNLTNLNGENLKSKPVRKESISSPSAVRESDVKRLVAKVEGGDYCYNFLNEIRTHEKANEMIISICNFALTKTRLSEKQAYHLVLFASNNNIEIN